MSPATDHRAISGDAGGEGAAAAHPPSDLAGLGAPSAAIAAWGDLPALPRLLEALARRGHATAAPGDTAGRTGTTLVTGAWSEEDMADALHPGIGRVLVLSWMGAHPDAASPGLRRQWAVEERARALGLPALTLRLAPLMGPESPFWRRLRARGPLPRGGRTLLRPVVEEDVIESIHRALVRAAAWSGWFEACGAETWSLAELADLAQRDGPNATSAAWEPPIEVLLSQRLPEPGAWRQHFGLAPETLVARARAWS